MAETPRSPRRRPHRRIGSWLINDLELGGREQAALVLLGSSVALGTLAFLGLIAGYDTLAGLLRSADWRWLSLAIAGQAAAYLGYALAYRELTGMARMLTRVFALVASGFGVFILRGGFVGDYELLIAFGFAPGEARVRVLRLGALEYALLAVAACVSAVVLLLTAGGVPLALTVPWAVGVPAGFVAAFVLLDARHRWRARSGWRGRAANALDAVALLVRIAKRPRAEAIAAVGMAVYWAGDVLCLWASLRTFLGHPPLLTGLIVAYATGYTLTRRTLPLAGAGVVEASLPFALFWVGFPFAPALLAVFVYRAFNLWLPLIPALAGYRRLRRDHAATGDQLRG